MIKELYNDFLKENGKNSPSVWLATQKEKVSKTDWKRVGRNAFIVLGLIVAVSQLDRLEQKTRTQEKQLDDMRFDVQILKAEAKTAETVDVNTIWAMCETNRNLGLHDLDCDEFAQEFLQLRRQKVLNNLLETNSLSIIEDQ